MSRGQRRLAAIMFTDMVGFTALTQADESRSLEVLARHNRILRSIFPKFRGREIKSIGDSFLVEFDSALDAFSCAVEIQSFLHDYNVSTGDDWKITLRIGIHLGDVVRQERDVLGDAVNIASRIQPLAEREGVCISEQVYDQVRNKVSLPLLRLKPQGLKGIRTRINVYRVVMPWQAQPAPSAANTEEHRLAVLPFKNMSPDPSDGYFADGLTEELISTLSAVRGLRVVSRTSVMAYKDAGKLLSEIGRELNVGNLVEGSVRKAGSRVRITVQLLDARTDDHLWAESYDRSLDDIFTIQSEVSESVARALRVRLVKSERERLAKTKTRDMRAYQDYLLGKHLSQQGSEEHVKESILLFGRAVASDPMFAEAYDGLAGSYELMGHNSYAPWNESMKRSKDAVRRALELDPDLAAAHATLGFLVMTGDWDLTGAEKEFRRAIELDPSDSSAHRNYSRCLAALGRLDEACEHARTARELDPLAPRSYSDEGQMYYLSGRDEEAFAVWAKAHDLFPGQDRLHFFPILARLARGEYEEARLELSRTSPDYGKEPHGMYLQGMVHAYLGRREEALRIAGMLGAQVREGRASGDLYAGIYAAIGDYEQFFKLALEAVRLHHWELYVLKNHDRFYPKLAGDPRWGRLLSEAGLGG